MAIRLHDPTDYVDDPCESCEFHVSDSARAVGDTDYTRIKIARFLEDCNCTTHYEPIDRICGFLHRVPRLEHLRVEVDLYRISDVTRSLRKLRQLKQAFFRMEQEAHALTVIEELQGLLDAIRAHPTLETVRIEWKYADNEHVRAMYHLVAGERRLALVLEDEWAAYYACEIFKQSSKEDVLYHLLQHSPEVQSHLQALTMTSALPMTHERHAYSVPLRIGHLDCADHLRGLGCRLPPRTAAGDTYTHMASQNGWPPASIAWLMCNFPDPTAE